MNTKNKFVAGKYM